MTKAIQNKIEILENNNRLIFVTLASCVFLCFSTYMFFVGGAFLGGIERQEISRQFEITSNSVHTLESEYLSLRNSIDEQYVKNQGFVAVKENGVRYVSLANESDTSLALNNR